MASQETLYLKLERNVEVEKEDVQLSDLGKLVCANKDILAHAKAMKIYKFRDTKPQRQVVSVMKIIESLQKLYPELTVENLGETDIIMERVRVKREKGPAQWLKIASVSYTHLSAYGYEIVPVNSIAGWLFLVFSVLLLHSIYFKWENNGDVLSGTMAVFSLYLLVRCVCVAVLAAFGAWGGWLLFGGRVLTLLLVSLLFCTPFYGALQQLVLTGGIAVWIVSSDIAVLLMVALTVVSFQAERFLSHSGLLTVLVLACLLYTSRCV